MMKLILNSNDQVKVTLTDSGVAMYKVYCREWNLDTVDFSIRERKFTLWELMQIFGPHMYMGMEVPFKDNVLEVV